MGTPDPHQPMAYSTPLWLPVWGIMSKVKAVLPVPAMADLHAFERGHDVHHGIAQGACLAFEVRRRLGAEAAEEDPRAVLVGPKPARRIAVLEHRARARRDVLDPIPGQRLGRDHEGVHRHHAAPQPLRGLGRVAVGRHDHVPRPHRAARCRDAEAAAVALDGLHRAVANDLGAVARGPLQQARMVEARVDGAVAAQDLAAVVAPFAVGRGHRLGLDHLRIHRDPVFAHHGEVVREAVENALGRRRDEAPGVTLEAGDLLLLDQGGRIVMGGDRRAANLSRALPPELRHHLAVLVPDLAAEIAGIARAGAVPCGLGIEHHRPPPRRASVSAAERPTFPAPTITTSASAGGPAAGGSGRGAKSHQ